MPVNGKFYELAFAAYKFAILFLGLFLLIGCTGDTSPKPSKVTFIISNGFRGGILVALSEHNSLETERQDVEILVPKTGIAVIRGGTQFPNDPFTLESAKWESGELLTVRHPSDKPPPNEICFFDLQGEDERGGWYFVGTRNELGQFYDIVPKRPGPLIRAR